MLQVRNVSKTFAGQCTPALAGVSFDVERGNILAVIGPSGAGKTTLLRALSVTDPPDTGEIRIDKQLMRFPGNATQPSWPDVTVVFQQLFLWPHLTLLQNILLPQRYTPRTQQSDVLELCERFAISHVLSRRPHEASVGERQRAAIVRGLALKPKLLLLDEITSSQDIERVSMILKHLASLRESGMTMVIVTHHLPFATRVANRVMFLDEGKVIALGGSEVLEHPSIPRIRAFMSHVQLEKE